MSENFLLNISHPIIKNHRVYGQNILPGLAYIDMIYQFIREKGYEFTQLELCNLTIYHPLTIGAEENMMIHFECVEIKPGQWQIQVEGQLQHGGTFSDSKILYVTAEMYRRDSIHFEDTLDLDALKQAAKNSVDLEKIYDEYRSLDLVHTGFMKAEGNVYKCDGFILIAISLGEKALSNAEGFMFHPTLIDGSAIGSIVASSSMFKKDQQLYLPLVYESFRASELLQQKCITRIQSSLMNHKNELSSLTMEFFNESGKKVAELKNVTSKLVRDAESMNPNRKIYQQITGTPVQTVLRNPQPPMEPLKGNQTGIFEETEVLLRQLLADQLNKPMNQIETEVGYYEMGLNSADLLKVVKRIEARINHNLSPTLLFEYTTIKELALYLSQNHTEAFGEILEEQSIPENIKITPNMQSADFIPESVATIPISEDIAIIGMAGRYPGANDLRQFWSHLQAGKDCISEIPTSRWDWRQMEGFQSPSGKGISKWGGFIEDADCFDPQFFRISPREAESLDPQERLFLETCWETIEDAGYTPKNLVCPQGINKRNPVGVFVGVMHKDYTLIELEALLNGNSFSLALNQAPIANRVSYFCNFHGPSIAVDTACSSSMIAVHLALESIKRGECEVALAGGVNLSLHAGKYYTYGMMDFHSSDGFCHTFGKGGDGYVSAEGVGAVLLKPLSKATRDGDHIYAVIKGSSINHGGTVSGFTVPSPVAQSEVIAECLEKTRINPRTISYVEAHGTGTSLGDPIEIEGLVKAYRPYTEERQYCAIGSVKSNIGHAEAAAGISALHKVALQLNNKTLVASLHSEELNPHLDLQDSPFYIQHQTEEWRQSSFIENGRKVCYPRRAGISSFGASGSNAHIILEEYLPEVIAESTPPEKSNPEYVMVPFSAKNKERLCAYTHKMFDFLSALTGNQEQQEKQIKLKKTLQTKLRKIIAELGGVNEADIDMGQEWQEYGFDPVQIAKFHEKVVTEFKINIQELDQRSSIYSVAAVLMNNHEIIEVPEWEPTRVHRKNETVKEPAPNTEPINLRELAYTLQIGREAMEERVVFLVKNIWELMTKLKAFAEGQETIDHCWRGHGKQNQEMMEMFSSDPDSMEIIQKWIASGKVKKISELWVKGYPMDWQLLYQRVTLRRISLPTYPFARERYWVPEIGLKTGKIKVHFNQTAYIHPLLHQNTSDLSEQRYSSSFSGGEFFLKDHILNGQPVLPSMVSLEMARAAVEEAMGIFKPTGAGIQLKDIIWDAPIAVYEESIRIHIGLYTSEQGKISYEIYSNPQTSNEKPIIHSQGSAIYISSTENPTMNTKAIQAQCNQQIISAAEVYETYQNAGIQYGPGYKGIEEIYIGANQVLAKLVIPTAVAETYDQFGLHPSILESALQATIFLWEANCFKSVKPVTIKEVQIFGNCTCSIWALIREHEAEGQSNNNNCGQKLDIDLCDEQGIVLVRIIGLETRADIETKVLTVYETGFQNEKVSTQEAYELMSFEEVWQEEALPEMHLSKDSTIKPETLVCFLSNPERQQTFIEAIREQEPSTELIFIAQGANYRRLSRQQYEIPKAERHGYIETFQNICQDYQRVSAILYLWPVEEPNMIEDYSGMVYLLQAMGAGKLTTGRVILAGEYKNEIERCYLESWIGVERSTGLIMPNTQVTAILQGVREPNPETIKDWAYKLWAELQIPKAESVMYQEWKRYVCQIQPVTIPASKDGNSPIKAGGTYLITGGCGELGLLVAEHLAKYSRETEPVNLILSGRSPLNTEKQAKIKTLEALGSRVIYIQADVSNASRMRKGLIQAKKDFGDIHGFIHAAGIEGNQIIFEKEIQEFQKVLKPKIKGTLVLDELLKEDPLEFVCYFSSSSAILGDFGSCDYAIANRFLMAYADHRNRQEQRGERRGKTIAINWPLWKDGGMGVGNKDNTEMYLKSSGQRALQSEEGLAAFDRILARNSEFTSPTCLIIAGQPSRVHRFLGITPTETSTRNIPNSSSSDKRNTKRLRSELGGFSVEHCLEWDLKEQISRLLKISRDKLNWDENLADFGFDSVSITELANALTNYYQITITPAVFYGYSTVEKLKQYFLNEYQEAIREFYREEQESAIVQTKMTPVAPKGMSSLKPRFMSNGVCTSVAEPIAIIGMSGRFPQANTVEEFWQNLCSGKDCITEIPLDRWDWRKYEGDPKQQENKTNCKWGGFIPDIAQFDPLFFEIAPSEAERMDPGQRLFLEEAWHTFEDAGYMEERIQGKLCGVFVGVEESDYGSLTDSDQVVTNNHNATLAARIAYKLDLKGPNLALTAACSSGLVAIHQACQSLRQGDCEMALVGGVSILNSPMNHLLLGRLGMLSSDGKCYVFDRRADGLVPGEAVAAVLLKPLSKAIADRDHIYGCIKASGVNYDGKTNGITAPSPLSQADLIKNIYDKYRVAPNMIQYVLAHSVGSKLGDSIEIEALTKAYFGYTAHRQYCNIGSFKPLIGHTFAASGVVSIIGMVMAMKNQLIPATHHYEFCNEHINFPASPFIINQENQIWTSHHHEPRMGAVSTTGISGTNAHVVIEEYVPEIAPVSITPGGYPAPLLFVLSAKSDAQLKIYAQKMKSFMESHEELSLADMAYTLQHGREAMEYRMAFPFESRVKLLAGLTGFIDGNPSVPVITGQVSMANEQGNFEGNDGQLPTSLSKLKLQRIAEIWVKGAKVAWEQIYGDRQPQRISLPTYPFTQEKYWLSENGLKGGGNISGFLHPLLHQNISDFMEQKFSSVFTGREFFLQDHRVKGRKVLPGVASLEMARAAFQLAAGDFSAKEQEGIRLKNVAWGRPIVIGEQSTRVQIRLFPQTANESAYEIFGEIDGEQVVYTQGIVELSLIHAYPGLALQDLQTQCQHIIAAERCYEIFRSIGMDYGPGHRGIESIYVGKGEVLAKLSLPSSVSDTREQFVLHPSLMDSALQASIGLMSELSNPGSSEPQIANPSLPFALEELEIINPCPPEMWVWIRNNNTGAGEKTNSSKKLQKLDLDLCDHQGQICIRMKGFTSRTLGGEFIAVANPNPNLEKTIALETGSSGTKLAVPEYTESVINLEATPEMLREKAINYFKKLLSTMIKLPAERIEADALMEKYGIDSPMIIQLTNQLEKTFGSLSKTLFFEYQNIRDLSGYFLETYREQLMQLMGVGEGAISAKYLEKSLTQPVGFNQQRFPHLSLADTKRGSTPGNIDIAIIGLSGRYPQARNVQEFWRNLRDGRDCITEIPKDRWDYSQYYDEDKDKPGKTYSKWGGFIDGVDQFDPLFFNISPREAEMVDPQERLFLQCVYETLEDAGYTRENLSKYQGLGLEGNVGVYVGVMYEEYQLYTAQALVQGFPVTLSGNPSSIANRVSYFCNFHGPSVAIDTMCSSSLTAIHLACQSIQRGGCKLAIAGGVNVSIHPNKYLMLGQGKFVSSKGRCESFGQGGDGYVPGEGVGAVLLKPLSNAITDGDHIYGVIKGTAINHGGKTNGYSVPNPNAQAAVIGQALQEAGIDPRIISYIEAHGTGTSLGDPIEITGLSKAFQKYTKEQQFCAIGSAKSNIGHCESAAGIAGVTKVLLQLKHSQIVPSLHSEILNPHIDFLNTPFIVQQELAEWKRPVIEINGIAKEYPRIAGISSFGAGGSNAHIVIEEYIPWSQEQPVITFTSQSSAIIVLSAKNEEKLKEQARRLLGALEEQKFTDAGLANIAYTLQVGREAMEERLALVIGSLRELEEKLKDFLEGRDGIIDLYRGQVKRNQETLAVFIADEDWQKTVESWIAKRKYSKILDLWVKGLIFDWNKIYGEKKPRRISLPTYPFAKECYWASVIGGTNNYSPLQATLHPLLHQNTSDFWEQRFSSRFTGEEFFISDHIVNGQKVLPGVASLEMARAAIELAAGAEVKRTVLRLKDVVWTRPIVIEDEPLQVRTMLYLEENSEIRYEINGEAEGGEIEVYSQGRAMLMLVTEIPVLDLQAIQADCGEGIVPADEVYQAYREMGIQYGPGHQGIERIYLGQEQVLAKLSLPSSVVVTQDLFILHPSMMDAALQASIGIVSSLKDRNPAGYKGNKPLVPFTLKEVEVFERTTVEMWAWVRTSEGNKADDKVRKLDIDLCDEHGKVCVRLKEFSARALEGKFQTGKKKPEVPVETILETQGETIMLAPVWAEVSIKRLEPFPAHTAQIVMVGGTKEQQNTIRRQYPKADVLEIASGDGIEDITEKLEAYSAINHILWIAPDHSQSSLTDEALIKKQNQGVLQVFRIIKAMLSLGYGTRELGWSLITKRAQPVNKKEEVNPTHASLHGLAGSMAKEYPNWKIRLIDLESNQDLSISDIFTLPTDSEGNSLIFRGGEWYRQQLIPARSAPAPRTLYKNGGIYVVIGGAGGIGEAWSEYVIRTYEAQIVWIGRREKDEVIKAKIDRLASFGPKPLYIAADATKRKALEAAYQEIKQFYPRINGIIHSAIVLLDKSLANMEEEQFQAGLSAKVDVSVRMAQVFRNEPLDFVMFFSSMQSFMKAAGQSNYASGCTFKDAFAYQLNLEWPCPVKVMNWGYWGNVGIVASKAYRERMAHAGLGSIEPPEAMEALERLLAGPVDQIALIKTSKPLAMEGMNTEKLITIYPENHSSIISKIQSHPILPDSNLGILTNNLVDEIETSLKQTSAIILKAKKEDIDVNVQLDEYGFDPVMSREFINRLNEEYQLDLTFTILIKYPTIRRFAQYLEREYQDLFSERLMGQGG